MSGGINWDYAVVQRLDRKTLNTKLIPFHLGRAIENESSPDNLALQPGDVVTIFSESDIKVPLQRRAKYVRLEGEFMAAGVYEVQPGETLQQLVARAGGLTVDAYLFGSEFTRRSTRQAQQKRLDQFVDQLDRDVERISSSRSQNVINPEEAAGLAQKVESQRRLVQKLRATKATGRMVLGLGPAQTDMSAIPQLVLEDGDRFFVPFRPAMINVVGAVYNENSFLHLGSKNASQYLRDAGGPTRQADQGRTFVIRADGSVVSKRRASGWFAGGFDDVKMMPGDTIVVPEKLDTTGILKGLKDWSQVIGQFALGAAAIRTLTRP
jgi:polysaccharide biosynthesis/export protein